MTTKVDCAMVTLTVLIAPLGLLCMDKKVADKDILINLVIYLLLTPLGGQIHAFYLLDMHLLTAVLNCLLPPVGVYLGTKDIKKTLICLLLTFCFFLPGCIYANYHSINSSSGGKNTPLA